MKDRTTHSCSVCGQNTSAGQPRFLLAENVWEDKLKILQWDEQLAREYGVRRACSAAHVRDLVVAWMATGTLSHPFAKNTAPQTPRHASGTTRSARREVDTSKGRQIGELSVDRESVHQILLEQPKSLKCILDAITVSLQQESRMEAAAGQWWPSSSLMANCEVQSPGP